MVSSTSREGRNKRGALASEKGGPTMKHRLGFSGGATPLADARILDGAAGRGLSRLRDNEPHFKPGNPRHGGDEGRGPH